MKWTTEDGVRFPTGGRRDFSHFRNSIPNLGISQAHIRLLWAGSFSGVKRVGREIDHLLASISFYDSTGPSGPGLLRCQRFFMITFKHTTLCKIPLDEWSVDLKTHNAYKRHTSMSPAGFELAIPGRERPQTDVFTSRSLGLATSVYYWG